MSKIIVSLSTIPPRFGEIRPTLDTLLDQSAPADQVLLYIPHRYRRFPDWDGTLPSGTSGSVPFQSGKRR